MGRSAESEAEYQKSMAIYQKLAEDNPSMSEFRGNLADGHSSLGFLLHETGRSSEAQAEFSIAMAIQRQLADGNPTVTKLQSDLARSHHNLGYVLSESGKPLEAEAEYRQAKLVYQKLIDRDPTVIGFCAEQANNLMDLGVLLSETGRLAESEAEHRRTIARVPEADRRNPKVPNHRVGLAGSLYYLGDVVRMLGRPTDARQDYEQAIAIHEKLVKESKNPWYRGLLAQSLAAVGWRCATLGDAAGAVADTRRALGLYDGLAARSGEEWFETACCHAALEGLAGRPGSGVSAAEVSEHVAQHGLAAEGRRLGLPQRQRLPDRIRASSRCATATTSASCCSTSPSRPRHSRHDPAATWKWDNQGRPLCHPGRMPFDRASEAHDESLPNRLDPGPALLILGASTASGQHQIVCSGEAAGGYAAFPDLCRLPDGELFCVFYSGYGHVSTPNARRPKGGRIMAVRSADDGQSWSAPTVVIDTPQDDRDPSVSCLKDGTLLLDWFTLEQGRVAVLLARSTDQGKTWSEPVHVDPDTHVSFACSAPIRELPDGSLILGLYHEDGPKDPAFGATVKSSDGGKTWRDLALIGKNAHVFLDAETDVVPLKSGSCWRPCDHQPRTCTMPCRQTKARPGPVRLPSVSGGTALTSSSTAAASSCWLIGCSIDRAALDER